MIKRIVFLGFIGFAGIIFLGVLLRFSIKKNPQKTANYAHKEIKQSNQPQQQNRQVIEISQQEDQIITEGIQDTSVESEQDKISEEAVLKGIVKLISLDSTFEINPNGTIIVFVASKDSIEYTTLADSSGDFSIKLPSDSYTVKIDMPGFKTYLGYINASLGGEIDLQTIQLQEEKI